MPSLQLYGDISFYAFVIHENSLWMSWRFFFFFLLFLSYYCRLGVAQPKILALMVQEVNSQLRPLKVITCHLFCTPQSNFFLCLLLILHVLLPLVHLAKWCSGCLLDLTSRQTCGSCMTRPNQRRLGTSAWKTTRFWCSTCREPKHCLLISPVCCWENAFLCCEQICQCETSGSDCH